MAPIVPESGVTAAFVSVPGYGTDGCCVPLAVYSADLNAVVIQEIIKVEILYNRNTAFCSALFRSGVFLHPIANPIGNGNRINIPSNSVFAAIRMCRPRR